MNSPHAMGLGPLKKCIITILKDSKGIQNSIKGQSFSDMSSCYALLDKLEVFIRIFPK